MTNASVTRCVDASVAIEGLLELPKSAQANAFWNETLESNTRLLAPALLYAETTAVLRLYVHRRHIDHDYAKAALQDLLLLPIEVTLAPEVYILALELARRLGHARAYDVQYLAVAQLNDCPVVTLDRGLYESARTLGIAARLIE